ncbi:MAG: 4Fe-4S dicluster domain-containing protein [Candidatus Sulfobium sp.]|jgi:Fe-S-cluster-containing dehydrogenase component
MSINRRQFIKLAGLSAVLSVGGITAIDKVKANAQELPSGARATASAAGQIFGQSKPPLTAKRWGMVVDLSKFQTPEDYQKCIDACNRIHNIPDFGEKKDEVKWIWTDTFEHTFPDSNPRDRKEVKDGDELGLFIPEELKEKRFLLLCNHCDNPPCTRVCPTKATWKRESDGIVMMDQHRCIGCRFCMAACPFGARSFNWRDPRPFIKEENLNPEYPTRAIGVVEKCIFCVERLEQGLKPACVEKSNGGLVFGDLDDKNSDVRKLLRTHFSIRRKPQLGTQPSVYYLIGGIKNV